MQSYKAIKLNHQKKTIPLRLKNICKSNPQHTKIITESIIITCTIAIQIWCAINLINTEIRLQSANTSRQTIPAIAEIVTFIIASIISNTFETKISTNKILSKSSQYNMEFITTLKGIIELLFVIVTSTIIISK